MTRSLKQTQYQLPTAQFSSIHTGFQSPIAIAQRPYSTSTAPTADNIITELEDLYEMTKDEFEIATESTDNATIYAASDRDSARDALNELCAIYYLYTAREGDHDTGILAGPDRVPVSGEELLHGPRTRVVDPAYDPAEVSDSVRDEVRKRVAHRIRELRNAVQLLEERTKAD
ncbi:hypothetical protein N7495_005613 [Penicillium taxi]|uniref:uncharacterized protein n=1 Tax=Penicillium taxi TaxID=168475 RepID=UPI0025454E42|nr:uncharacterized protein N7495_005613 [Penicillium taxi]KAJ5893922.1 hypothetical protein N7495_005613 [Penicillium taxi]